MSTVIAPELTTKVFRTARWETKGVDIEERTFEGLLATWDEDLGADVIHRGTFKEWIADWKRSGETIKLLDHHNTWRFRDAMGRLLDAEEEKDGLWTKWRVVRGEDGT